MFDYNEEQLESHNAKLVRLGECLTLFIIILIVISIFAGLDARSMAIKNFENIKLVKNMYIFYFVVGFFPIIYLYIEDRRMERKERESKLWYGAMAFATLIIWTAIGWIMGFQI